MLPSNKFLDIRITRSMVVMMMMGRLWWCGGDDGGDEDVGDHNVEIANAVIEVAALLWSCL